MAKKNKFWDKTWKKGGITLGVLATLVTITSLFFINTEYFTPIIFIVSMMGLWGMFVCNVNTTSCYLILALFGILTWSIIGIIIGWWIGRKGRWWIKYGVLGWLWGVFALLGMSASVPYVIRAFLTLPMELLYLTPLFRRPISCAGQKVCLTGLAYLLYNPWGWAIIGIISSYLSRKFKVRELLGEYFEI